MKLYIFDAFDWKFRPTGRGFAHIWVQTMSDPPPWPERGRWGLKLTGALLVDLCCSWSNVTFIRNINYKYRSYSLINRTIVSQNFRIWRVLYNSVLPLLRYVMQTFFKSALFETRSALQCIVSMFYSRENNLKLSFEIRSFCCLERSVIYMKPLCYLYQNGGGGF